MSIYGFSTNDPIKHIHNWVERIHPEDRSRVQQAIDAIPFSRKDTLFQTEYRFLRGDGEYVFIYDRGYIMRDLNGHPVRVIGAAQDITERVKAGQMMRDSEETVPLSVQQEPAAHVDLRSGDASFPRGQRDGHSAVWVYGAGVR